MITNIHYMGPMRSGTTWFSLILRHNFDIEVGEKYLGKHSPDEFFRGRWNGRKRQKLYRTQAEEDQTLFMLIHRNVFAWLASVRLHPFGAPQLRNKPMSEFIRSSFTSTTERVREDRRYANFIQMRKLKLQEWRRLQDNVQNFVNCPWDDFVKETTFCLSVIKNTYDLSIRQSKIEYIGDISEERRLYYLNHQYMDDFTNKDIDFVLSQCNLETEAHFGYEYEGL